MNARNRESWRKLYEANPEKYIAKVHRYNARKVNAPGRGVTAEQWRAQQKIAQEMTMGMFFVAALSCAMWRWLHGVECWIET